MGSAPGVPQEARVHRYRPAASHHRPAAFELVRRQVHAVPIQDAQGLLDAIPADQRRQILFLAACEPEQLPIGIGGAGPEDPAEQGEEVGLALLEAMAEHGPRVLDRERTAKMAGEVPHEARPREEIIRREPEAGARPHRETPARVYWRLMARRSRVTGRPRADRGSVPRGRVSPSPL
jgi:hypothetical protein